MTCECFFVDLFDWPDCRTFSLKRFCSSYKVLVGFVTVMQKIVQRRSQLQELNEGPEERGFPRAAGRPNSLNCVHTRAHAQTHTLTLAYFCLS